MKVILGTESFPPNISGVATATVNLAENLTKAGHKAFVFTPGSVLSTKIDRRFPDYKVFRVKSISNPFREGYRITFTSEKEIERKILEIKPDIIHLQDPANIGRILRDIGDRNHIPVIITNHFSLEYALSYVKFFNLINPLLRSALVEYLVSFYDRCDQVVTPTETFAKQVRSWGVETPVCAVSNGLEIESFLGSKSKSEIDRAKQVFHLPDNKIVLYLGRVDKDKSIDVLVRAIPEVLKRVNAHFVIAGTGGEVENLQQLAISLDVSNDITFLGFIDHDSPDFVRLYKCASLFAIPSTIETQSLVTLEALASGLPAVGADANALPELIQNKRNGFLFKPGDSKELAKHITTILLSPKLAARMGAESVEIATGHKMKKSFAKMFSLYEEVIERTKEAK